MGWRVGTAAVLTVAAVTACSARAPVAQPPEIVQVTAPDVPTLLGIDDPAALAVATSTALFAAAPVAILAAADDPAAQDAAAPMSRQLGVPLLLTPPEGDPAGVGRELARLGAGTVLTIGAGAVRWARSSGRPKAVTAVADLPAIIPPLQRPAVQVFTDGAPGRLASVTTAAASGAQVTTIPGADPRRTPLPDPRAQQVLALGTAFGTQDLFTERLAVTATGTQLPGGGQVLFPGRRMVALYGSPNSPTLGVLGEQDVPASLARVRALTAQYQPLVDEPVVPAFELITTLADAAPGADGDYSAELAPAAVQPWVDAAKAAAAYVVLDLQPGRADFLTQAKLYAELLALPNVGLALEPEWRLGPSDLPRDQKGTVGVHEINRVVTWLADLTRGKKLPQKLLMIHQSRPDMISGRDRLDTSRDELSLVIESDGFGTPADKTRVWSVLHQGAPEGIRWGWKNYPDDDRPPFTPERTVPIPPTPPAFVSYQ